MSVFFSRADQLKYPKYIVMWLRPGAEKPMMKFIEREAEEGALRDEIVKLVREGIEPEFIHVYDFAGDGTRIPT